MTRDIWLDDDEPGCLECGALVFKASRVSGVCCDCIEEASFDTSFGSSFDAGVSAADGDDIPWTENS